MKLLQEMSEFVEGGVFSAGTTAPLPTPAANLARDLPEIETFEVELSKDNQGIQRFRAKL